MGKATAENYGGRTVEVDEAVDFRDEKLEHQDFQNDFDSTWERNNQHMVKFADELKAVNEEVALDFDRRKNPAEYDADERKSMLEAVTEAFNAANWNSSSEQRQAAEAVAHSIFQPMYHRVEIAEAAAQHRYPEQFVESLKEEKIEYLEQKIGEDGLPTEVLEFQVQDYDTALRMVEESKGTFHIVSTSRLDHFRDRFADALYNNQEDESARAMMEHQLESAVAYYNGDLGRDDRFGRAVRRLVSEQGEEWHLRGREDDGKEDDPEEDPLEALWHRETGAVEPDYRNMLSFTNLESMSAYEMDQEIREILNEELHHVQDYADQMKAEGHPDLDAVKQIQEALRDMTHDGIQGSVENGNGENFATIMRNMKGTDEELASELRQNAGFIEAEDYEPPTLPEKFETIQEMAEFADKAGDVLIDFKDGMSTLHHGIATNLLEKLDNRLEALEGIQADWQKAGYKPGDALPDGVTDPKVFNEDLQEAHRVAEALNYMMRPRDPELWGMWEKGNAAEDNEYGNRWSNLFREQNHEHLQEAFNALDGQERLLSPPDQPHHSENYANAILAVEMIAERLREGETHTTGIPEQEDGANTMADEFAMKYQPLLDESNRMAEYGLAVLAGTAHVWVDNPRKFGVEHSADGIVMPEGGMDEAVMEMEAYRVHYANMVIGGTGGNNPEGDPDSMNILKYAVETYDIAVNRLRDVRDPLRGESFETMEAADAGSAHQNLVHAARAAAVIDQIVTGRNEAD